MFHFHLFGMAEYTLINSTGIACAFLSALGMILLEWRRQRKRPAPSEPPLKWRHRFNPLTHLLCYGIAYALLMAGVSFLAPMLLNITYLAGAIRFFKGTINFASGVLVFIPVFLLLARFFPGNGRPTAQLERMMPALAINYFFTRLACFCAGCCYGQPSAFGVVYPDTALPSVTYGPGTRIFPVQPIEFGVALACFAVILILHFRGRRSLPVFPLAFGATGFWVGFASNHVSEPLKPILGFTYPTPLTHLFVFLIGIVFLVLIIGEKRKASG